MNDGATLFVKVLGTTQSNAPTLIALHGGPGVSTHADNEAIWDFLGSGFRVIVYDARGSGTSDETPPLSHERWVADIECLRIWAAAETFVLAGSSYGGAVSLDYALAFPERLSGLILHDTWAWGTRMMMTVLTTCLTSQLKVDSERQLRLWCGLVRNETDLVAAISEVGSLFTANHVQKETADPKIVDTTAISPTPIHVATHNAAFSTNQPAFDVRSRLKDISTPTLVVVGRHDMIAPLPFSEELHAGIPNSELAIFENSGHMPGTEEPEAFRERVERFMSTRILKQPNNYFE